LPSLGGTSAFTRSFRSAADECAAEAGSWSPGSSGRDVAEETTGSPKVPGGPRLSVCACATPTPAGPRAPDRYSAAAWPWVIERPRLPRGVFRRSIAWLPDSLFTLRRIGYPVSTQNSLPAVGQTLLGGLCTRKVPTEGFRVLVSSHPPSPSLLGAIDQTSAPHAMTRTYAGVSDRSVQRISACPRLSM
jgi:hypothetical protein